MKRGLAKTMLVVAIGVICWMLVRAFQPSQPRAAPALPEPVIPVELPPEDLALLTENSRGGNSLESPSTTTPAADIPSPPPATATKPAAPGPAAGGSATKTPHNQHTPVAAPAPKPKRKPVDRDSPVAVDGLGRAQLDWDVLATTRIDEQYRPTFAANVEVLDGKNVTLSGFMSPLDEVGAVTVFLLLEFPVGCFYCQTPEPTGIVLVELADGKQSPIHSSLVKVTGTLTLNRDDPEDFLYIVTGAEVSQAD